ncbi:MAG TPA: VWA domain-containing protein [Blastocatellia bacterium]|jgi:VWFA-related protein|nr:VWA domain-containing protein [Blastocatellia bacterium]
MRVQAKAVLVIGAMLSSLLSTPGQTPARTGQQEEPKVRIGTAEVVLDVVVRDKKGRVVKDLTGADFEVYEDGVLQRIESFRQVARATNEVSGPPKKDQSEARPTTPAATQRDAREGPSVTALVFDRLSPNARSLAHKAAMAYADEGVRVGDYTGVFLIDLSLNTLQTYTDNPQLVRQAVDRATSMGTSTFASNAEQVRSLSNRSAALERQGASSQAAASAAGSSRDSVGASAAGSETGIAAAEQALVEMNQRMLETFETLERDQQGYATINSLLAVVSSMRSLPGRKTVIFFSEGLSLPPNVVTKFNAVINAANRANVSIYSIDAAGLRIDSPNAEATREINAAADRRMSQLGRIRDDTSGPMTRALERNEDLLRLNPHSGLGQLADQTGGFLIRDTNDLGAGVRRIDEDMRLHYVVTYVPKNPELDGRFRQIAVKLSRPNLEVQTRKGYYAIPSTSNTPVLDYEARALAALGMAQRSNPLSLRLIGLSFPELARPGLTPILAEIPASAFTFTPDPQKKTYSADFSIVALIKDESKQVVQKVSQQYLVNGPIEKLEAAKRGEILFYREVVLPPGRYTIEAAAYDSFSNKASVQTCSLEAPGGSQANLRLSSIVILKRAERLTAEDKKIANPFHFGEVLIYPNTGEPLRKSATKQLTYFFTVYTPQGSTAAPKLTLEVQQNGKSMGQASIDLPAPDASGQIQYASAIPIDSFPPGAYELKVTVSLGTNRATRSGAFVIEQ